MKLGRPSGRALALLLLLSTPAPATGSSETPSVAGFLRPYVKTLTRPVVTWSYAPREKIGLPADGPVEPDDPALARYLQQRFGRYWDLSLEPHPYSMASGLYVAADPVASRAFGGVGDRGWSLMQVVLDPGFRFVDVRSPGEGKDQVLRFPPEILEALAAAGCDAKFAAGVITMLESRPCREVAVRTMAELDVDGILYDFRSAPLDGCDGRLHGAFILVRGEAVDLTRARVFTARPTRSGRGDEDRLRIRDLFLRAARAGSVRTPPWPDLEGIPAPAGPPDMDTWVRESLFGCGGHAEDALPDPAVVSPERLAERVAKTPGSAQARYDLGAALLREGRSEEGAAQLAEALRLDPDHVQALADLALLKTKTDPAEAFRLAEHLVGVTQYRQRLSLPRIVKLRSSMVLATAAAAAGRADRAREYAEHALEISSRQHAESATPLTARMLEDAKALVKRVGGSAEGKESPVAAALKARVRTLGRPVYTYHYAPRARIGLPASGYVAPDDPVLPAFLRGKVERYWDTSLPTREDAAASGLWAGIDPVAGRHFGGSGDGWALAQIVLPAGLRFVDAREGEPGRPDPGFPAAVRQALAEAGCAAVHPADLLMAAESAACRDVAVRALRELGVGGILGSFPRARFAGCGERPEGVFVLLDPALVAADRVRLLTRDPGSGDAAAEDRLRIEDLFARARQAGSMRPPPWPELAGALPPAGMEDWMRRHLLGCGDWPEDRPFAGARPTEAAEVRP